MTLKDLCRYYTKCVSLEDNTSVRVSMKDEKSFIALPWISKKFLNSGDAEAFIKGNFEKEKDIFIGFPIYKKGHNLCPVFIAKISIHNQHFSNASEFNIDDEIQLNKDIVDKYSTNDKSENACEFNDLEKELGFGDSGLTTFNKISEITTILKNIRPSWDWVDEIDIENLRKGPIKYNETNGIINRAILLAKDPTPYTVGLYNELNRLGQINEATMQKSILWKFLHCSFNKNKTYEKELYEVLSLNEEQKEAVRSALSSDVTLIAGPPGTGKTQVVANLIINAAISGQNVLFTSKNNNAVDLVVKRVNGINKKLPLVLRYERSTKECIVEYVQQWENYSNGESSSSEYYDAYKKICTSYERKVEQKCKTMNTRNNVDLLEQKICPLRNKYANIIGVLTDKEIIEIEKAYDDFSKVREEKTNGPKNILDMVFRKRWEKCNAENIELSVSKLNSSVQKYDSRLTANSEMSEREWTHFNTNYKQLVDELKLIADYNFHLNQLRDSASLEELDVQMMHEHIKLQEKATKAYNYWLGQRTRMFTSENRGLIHNYISLIEHDKIDEYSDKLKHILPISAITSLSARRRLPFKEAVYDLLIIDEASQCDIASMIPLMYRAKRIAVIGDKQQLNHICLINKQTDLSLLNSNNVEPRWSYRGSSIYDLAEGMAESRNIVQLRDHHRSFFDIIQFSNQEFYDNTLRIATDYSRLNSPNNGTPVQGMQWMNIKGNTIRPQSGGAYNLKEVEGVIRILKRISIELGFEGSIGVTTPFHLQSDMIKSALENDSDLRNHLELHNNLLIDTVHKFQGDERDVIIFSPVVSNGAQPQSLQFLKSTGNIFNVAITRARALLVTVGDKEYCKHCGVSYLEHFADYSFGDNAPVESSEWEHILQKALSDAGIPVTAQYHVDKYYLDLALFHNGKKLDIEVDGAMYHQTWTGESCYKDQLRNQALIRLGWDIRRFWVQQVRDQLPWCIEQIKKWMANN